MSGGEERFAYRGPLWMVPFGMLLVYMIWSMGTTAPVVFRVILWFVAAVSTLAVIGTLVSLVKKTEVVLSDHTVTHAASLRRCVCIEFGAVEKLEIREMRNLAVRWSEVLEINAPGQKIVLWDKAFRNRATFDHVVATIAARVAAHGGPELTRRPPSRADGAFVA